MYGHIDQLVTFCYEHALASTKVTLKRASITPSSGAKIDKKDARYWGLWWPWFILQISNGHAVPLSPGFQINNCYNLEITGLTTW